MGPLDSLATLSKIGPDPEGPSRLCLERVTRIELALSAWEAEVLPLNYTRMSLRPEYLSSMSGCSDTQTPGHTDTSRTKEPCLLVP